MTRYPKVTFVIPTLNAGWILAQCLAAIREQDYPQKKVEIVVADGGSKDNTLKIARRYWAKIINNPEVLHEPGKDRAAQIATGELIFFTDADNILSTNKWICLMVEAYLGYPNVAGFLPQTIPAPMDNALNRYLSFLSTDPFTWFVYRDAATPRTFGKNYQAITKSTNFQIFRFDPWNHPMLGLSQGFGTIASFRRGIVGHNDDILSGIKLIKEGGLIAYVPKAGVYHYHVRGWRDFWNKYKWRIRNNLYGKIIGMGIINRQSYLSLERKFRQYMFVPYSLSIVFPLMDTFQLINRYKDPVILLHPIVCILLSLLILKEFSIQLLVRKRELGEYGK